MSSTAKNTYGTAPGSPPWRPPGSVGVSITYPAPDGPGAKRHANNPS
jgi:hypothetical protein